jgi:hypothetical protein
MILVFKEAGNQLENILASGRYNRAWDEYKDAITEAFHRHTGLKFKQSEIPVRVIEGNRSSSTTQHGTMELSAEVTEPEEIATTLIHELAHHLLAGNGIDPPLTTQSAESEVPYLVHSYIDLFIYDVIADVLGAEAASRYSEDELRMSSEYYGKAWQWAMAKTYEERQQTLSDLKKHYRVTSQ